MNNTRNKVRLTESQLHQVIKESVKQVLSELDWKTYANAEKKAIEDYERSKKFRNAKVNAFNDTHNNSLMRKRSDDGPSFRDYDYMKTDVGPFFGNGYDGIIPDERYKPSFFYTDAKDRASEEMLNDTQEFSDYLQGNYEYEPNGKGWHLKDNMDESIRRAIRKVLR